MDGEFVAFLGLLVIVAIFVTVYLIIRAIKKGRVKKRFPLKNKAAHCNYGSTISDDRITAIKPHGIVYTDIFDREFVIDFADCANEYAKEGSSPFGCVGECDPKQLAYTFYTPRVKTKVVFDSALITGKKLHPLCGSRKKRFSELKKRIADQKYTVYMKNFD